MVSTRQMSSVGGGSAGSEGAGPPSSEPAAVPRVTRHSSALLPGGSSPHASTSKCVSLVPAPKSYTTNLLDLPVEVIEKIFSYLGFKSVSQLRMVNRQLNTICSGVLNSTFQRLQNQMLHRFQSIKAKMPRRESARRSHPLACESDIIETLHMRLSLLQMTFGKHIERKHCCFFPGEHPYCPLLGNSSFPLVLYTISCSVLFLPLPFDVCQRPTGDSSKSYMCMDSPPPSGFESSSAQAAGAGERRSSCERRGSAHNMYLEESLPPSPLPQSNMVLRKRIHRIKQGMKNDLRSCKRKTALQQKQIAEQQKQIAEQQKQTLEYANRLDDYDKKNEETSRKFQTLLQELNKCKTELQYWRSRSPAVPPLCAECGASLRMTPASLAQVTLLYTSVKRSCSTGGRARRPCR
ncbi:putative F-box only protein [Operophtera brumata]|uniref:Putative F-box only protein n=1 Tax=Operophtera brumata TaxID=104452 RepID=A0A0L7KR92_OPEBR|nr:putative F-box only protein [Operophtera brumata]